MGEVRRWRWCAGWIRSADEKGGPVAGRRQRVRVDVPARPRELLQVVTAANENNLF